MFLGTPCITFNPPTDQLSLWYAPSYYVQLCQPKCQIYEKTEYFEYATTVLKPNLFYLINLFGIKNVILQGKVEDKILNEARQRHITEKLQNYGTWNCGTLQRVFCLNNVAYRAMAHFYG